MSIGSLDQLVASAIERFVARYGRQPGWVVAAPGRVNLIGEHVDYNDGLVLPMAIERYCVLAAGEVSGDAARVFSVATDEEAAISLDSAQRSSTTGHWSNYFAGVISLCGELGLRPGGFEAVAESSVPVGGGLSSSAAIEVAMATLIEAMTGEIMDPVAKALLAQRAEHEYAGVPCGIMDMFASAMCRTDHLMLLDCRSRQMEHIPLRDPGVSVLITNTNVKHDLSGGEYAERRLQCESATRKLNVRALRDVDLEEFNAMHHKLDPIEIRRARHVITEIVRTFAAARAVTAGDWSQVGELMYSSHRSLRDEYEVSCRELDILVEIACEIGSAGGVFGSRMTGGGFGGCTVSLVETTKVEEIVEELNLSYRARTGIEPGTIVSRPARGAHVVRS